MDRNQIIKRSMDPFEVTNRKRENIFEEVAKLLKRRQELMDKKYQKKRQVKG